MDQDNRKIEEPVNDVPARYAEPEIDNAVDEDDAPTEWVPTRFEKRIKAIPAEQWNLYQLIVGILIGTFTVFALFMGGKDFSPLFWVAIALVLVFPRILEDRGRRSLTRLRVVMIVTIAGGMAAVLLYKGFTQGWDFLSGKPEEAAARARQFIKM